MGVIDALLVEKAIEEGWIKIINVNIDDKFVKTAKAGLHKTEVAVLTMLTKTVLLHYNVVRTFAKN